MTKEVLKLALEALVEVKSWKSPTRWDGCFDKEIAAIKEALNGCQCPECQVVLHTSDCAVHNDPAYPKGQCNCGAQPSVSVEQEPVAFEKTVCPFCTSEWVTAEQHDRNVDRVERKPLTDEEIMNIAKVSCIGISPQEDTLNFAKVIEAVHGIYAPTERKGEV